MFLLLHSAVKILIVMLLLAPYGTCAAETSHLLPPVCLLEHFGCKIVIIIEKRKSRHKNVYQISVSDLTESEQQIRQTTSVLLFSIFWRYNIQLVTNCNLLITPLLPPCYRLSSTSPQPTHHLIWLYLAYILHIPNI